MRTSGKLVDNKTIRPKMAHFLSHTGILTDVHCWNRGANAQIYSILVTKLLGHGAQHIIDQPQLPTRTGTYETKTEVKDDWIKTDLGANVVFQ